MAKVIQCELGSFGDREERREVYICKFKSNRHHALFNKFYVYADFSIADVLKVMNYYLEDPIDINNTFINGVKVNNIETTSVQSNMEILFTQRKYESKTRRVTLVTSKSSECVNMLFYETVLLLKKSNMKYAKGYDHDTIRKISLQKEN